MSLRSLGFLSAALLTAATLTACSAEPVEADAPPALRVLHHRPARAASATTDRN
ncbi:hypothetical protein [Streptomyces sp. DH7]|uniref:hypothetical protein n=1 Tax=Streptomyces sp. DH7 TaxID=2857006 RepID=UPI001E2D7E61|nr:hypothetical protein [Streptomyces sp. DH7]